MLTTLLRGAVAAGAVLAACFALSVPAAAAEEGKGAELPAEITDAGAGGGEMPPDTAASGRLLFVGAGLLLAGAAAAVAVNRDQAKR